MTGAFQGQKKPPCTPRKEREIMGACWVPHVEKPPCPEDTFEHKGACYMAIMATKRPPTSIYE
jgi:hypothetical protein